MIESSATVVSGNSGGALVNSRGELLGITVSSQSGGSPSFSVPISVLDEMDGTVALSPQQYTQAHRPDASRCYENLYPVPDFGAVTGVPLYAHTRDRGTGRFYYRMADMADSNRLLLEYYAALGENTFYQFSDGAFTSSAGYLLSVQLYETTYQGEAVLGVFVSGMQTLPVGGLPRAAGVFYGGLHNMMHDKRHDAKFPASGIISQKCAGSRGQGGETQFFPDLTANSEKSYKSKRRFFLRIASLFGMLHNMLAANR